jgi:hypothetical protein
MAYLENINSNEQIGGSPVTSINQVPTLVEAFGVQATITRSTTVTAYSSGQIILNSGASVLPTIDFSVGTGLNLANRRIAITSAFLISNNGVNPAFSGYIDLFNINNPAVASTLADYVTFNPTYSGLLSGFTSTLDSMMITRKYGATSNLTMQTDMLRKCTLDANGRLYFAPVLSGAYTPANGETLTLILKFYLLN